MSLDISLYSPDVTQERCFCVTCGNDHFRTVRQCLFSGNITHNLNSMASRAGLYTALWRPEEYGIRYAREVVPHLESGLEMLNDQEMQGMFEQFNPENGWGSLGGLKAVAREYLEACKQNPESLVEVCR